MKSMMKTIFDYDTDESTHEDQPACGQKRPFEHDDYLMRNLMAHKNIV